MKKKWFVLIIAIMFWLVVGDFGTYANSQEIPTVICSFDFENGKVAPFTNRNSTDPTKLSVVDTSAYSGGACSTSTTMS